MKRNLAVGIILILLTVEYKTKGFYSTVSVTQL